MKKGISVDQARSIIYSLQQNIDRGTENVPSDLQERISTLVRISHAKNLDPQKFCGGVVMAQARFHRWHRDNMANRAQKLCAELQPFVGKTGTVQCRECTLLGFTTDHRLRIRFTDSGKASANYHPGAFTPLVDSGEDSE